MGEKSPLDPSLLFSVESPRNVLLYVDGSAEIVMCDNMNADIIFKDSEIYEIDITSAPTPVDPTPVVGNPVITFGVNIVNNTGQTVTLDGDMYFVLSNPDRNGNYLGWEGAYNKTGHIKFSSSSETFVSGETKSFGGLTWEDDDTGMGMGGKSPLNPSQLAAAGYHNNVAVYVGGSGEVVYCADLDPSIVFEEGGTYTIYLSSVGSTPSVNPTPTPTPSTGGNPAISINLRITNAHGSAVSLDGDLKFTLGNPDKFGNYFGWPGPYTGTDHIYFSGPVTLAAGETRIFYNVGWTEKETGWGLGGKSPADAAQLAAAERPRNVVLYIGGNSEIVLCDNMDPNIVFEQGGTYDIVIR